MSLGSNLFNLQTYAIENKSLIKTLEKKVIKFGYYRTIEYK